MEKNSNKSPYLEFRLALKYLISKNWKGKQKILVDLAGISFGFLSQIKKGERVSSTKVQYDLAKALGVSYEEMINIGKKLIKEKEKIADKNWEPTFYIEKNFDLNEYSKNHRVLIINGNKKDTDPSQQTIINRFLDKKKALEINIKLIEIENRNPDGYKKLQEIIELFYKDIEMKKKVVND